MDQRNHDAIVKAEIAKFPETFGMKSFPGELFKISFTASYLSDFPEPGTIYLYTLIRRVDGSWVTFCKGTPDELRSVIV